MTAIFLDIDGVMLPGRAYALPENLRRQQLLGTPGYTGDLLDRLPVDFDPVAVSLVNRLAVISGARIVLHSDWRRHYDRDELRGHLLRQGLEARLFHDAWWLEAPFAQRKQEAILDWLAGRGIDPGSEECRFVVIDDDPVFSPAKDLACAETRRRLGYAEKRHVRVDGEIGLTLADYRKALSLFGCSDLALERWKLGW